MPNNAVQTCYPTPLRSIHTDKVILLKTSQFKTRDLSPQCHPGRQFAATHFIDRRCTAPATLSPRTAAESAQRRASERQRPRTIDIITSSVVVYVTASLRYSTTISVSQF